MTTDIECLWYDDDKKRDTALKVKLAAEFYKNKYGVEPTVCYVNPQLLDNGVEGQVGHIRVIGKKTVMVNYFWLGVEEKETK